jgi:uncharacterized zinc-type alcohol dehydrogenase-like protein
MTTVNAWGPASAGASILPMTIERRAVGANDIRIDIVASGICHSDIHQVFEEWGPASFPMVPGHEIMGRVAEMGTAVQGFTVGEAVGVGCFIDSCRECDACKAGLQNYCSTGGTVWTYNSRNPRTDEITYGGYAQSIVVDAGYVLHVPENLDPHGAAPLLCAGITLWSPLQHWKVGAGSRVGIIGLGGLGHMGVKLAVALGAHVTVFSHSEHKRDAALSLGAHAFVNTSELNALHALNSSLDLIINTVSADIALEPYMLTLRQDGSLVVVGLPTKPVSVHVGVLAQRRRTLSGSSIGGIPETQELLNFCGEHGIVSDVEVVSPAYIDAAYRRVIASDVKYRFVIDVNAG